MLESLCVLDLKTLHGALAQVSMVVKEFISKIITIESCMFHLGQHLGRWEPGTLQFALERRTQQAIQ